MGGTHNYFIPAFENDLKICLESIDYVYESKIKFGLI